MLLSARVFQVVKIIDYTYLKMPYFELLLTVRYQINQDFLSSN